MTETPDARWRLAWVLACPGVMEVEVLQTSFADDAENSFTEVYMSASEIATELRQLNAGTDGGYFAQPVKYYQHGDPPGTAPCVVLSADGRRFENLCVIGS